MGVVIITPPGDIVGLAEAKQHLRVDHEDDDAYIGDLIATAATWLDGPSGGWIGRALGAQTLELRAGCFERVPQIPFPPVIEIVSVVYDDPSGAGQTVAPALYGFDPDAGLYFNPGFAWPSVAQRPDAVRIRYRAGYVRVPAPIRLAMLMLVGQWYAGREAASDKPLSELPFAVEALLSPFRVWS